MMKKSSLLSLMLAVLFTACKEKADINKLYNESGEKLELEFKYANIDGKDYDSFRDGYSYHVTYDKIKHQLRLFSPRTAGVRIDETYNLGLNKFHCTDTQICFDRVERDGGERIIIENAGDYYIAHVSKLHKYGKFQSEWVQYITFHNSSGRTQQTQQAEEPLSLKQVFTVVYATSDDGFVNIREQPSSKAKVLGELHTPFERLGEGVLIEKGDDWCKVNVRDVIGYVYTKYIGFETWYEGSGDSILVANIPKTIIYENAEVEDGPLKFSVVEKGTILGDRFENFGEYYVLPTAGNYLLVRKEDSRIVIK